MDHAESSGLTAHGMPDDAVSGSTSTPPPTSKTSPSHTEVADVPRISATCFTSLLGAMLTDTASVVAKATEAAFVRFLCRLKDKPMPVPSPPPSPMLDTFDVSFEFKPSLDTAHHEHPSYQPGPDAARVVEDEFITGIVLGLARLDEDEHQAEGGREDGSAQANASLLSQKGLQSDHATPESTPPTLVMSPEQEPFEDEWSAAGVDTSAENPFETPGHTAGTWGEPLMPFTSHGGESTSLGVLTDSSPMEQVYSSFSPDAQQGEDESSVGKMVSMSLIGACAAADCLEQDVLVSQVLPEVDRMKSEPMFFVRKEAAQALGAIVRLLPVELVESTVVSLNSS